MIIADPDVSKEVKQNIGLGTVKFEVFSLFYLEIMV